MNDPNVLPSQSRRPTGTRPAHRVQLLHEFQHRLGAGEDGDSEKPTVTEDQRSILVAADQGSKVDASIVRFEYYNRFNYSMLSDTKRHVQLTLGIGSANPGEGKTTTAANLAASLTLGFQKRTVLVDCNFGTPRIHEVFGAPIGPGLRGALEGEPIQLIRTKIENLFILPAGPAALESGFGHFAAGVEHTASFGSVIATLEAQFDFVIVDMPSISTESFPVLFLNHLNGLLIVVEVGKTRRQDLDKLFRIVNRNQVLGFVFNRMEDE